MNGFPKHLNTKEDYLYIRDHFPDEQWKPVFYNLLDTQKEWLNVGELEVGQVGVEDDTHKIVSNKVSGSEDIVRYQYEYKVDQNCLMYRLGFTEKEVTDLIA